MLKPAGFYAEPVEANGGEKNPFNLIWHWLKLFVAEADDFIKIHLTFQG